MTTHQLPPHQIVAVCQPAALLFSDEQSANAPRLSAAIEVWAFLQEVDPLKISISTMNRQCFADKKKCKI